MRVIKKWGIRAALYKTHPGPGVDHRFAYCQVKLTIRRHQLRLIERQITPAGIGQDPDVSAAERVLLQPPLDRLLAGYPLPPISPD
ncbi:hypothetical protein [Pseudomonas sp. B707]|uniref:hypothetical protein n=1 Tax=Pseudomonas sp. B707 TaxID=2689570 RepID=UPI003211DF8F|nr:hypothetical protein [Pseudomonas sp. B707]